MSEHDSGPVDRRLQEYGERWRRLHPPVPNVGIPHGRSRRTVSWWLAPVAAAAVAAVIFTAQLSTGGDQARVPPSAPPPTQTQRTDGVVPWKPLAATNATIPVTHTPGTPGPGPAEAAPPARRTNWHLPSRTEVLLARAMRS